MTNTSIDVHMSVNEVLRRIPASIAVFNKFGVEACCGGAASLAQAALDANADLAALTRELEAASAPAPSCSL